MTERTLIILQRGKTGPHGQLGAMTLNNEFLCYTLEEPWRNNAPADYKGETESCIPEGTYRCVRHGWEPDTKLHFKRVWRLEFVPGRKGILIHAGNTTADTEGCILVGLKPVIGGIGDSQKALSLLRARLPETFMLEVRNP